MCCLKDVYNSLSKYGYSNGGITMATEKKCEDCSCEFDSQFEGGYTENGMWLCENCFEEYARERDEEDYYYITDGDEESGDGDRFFDDLKDDDDPLDFLDDDDDVITNRTNYDDDF